MTVALNDLLFANSVSLDTTSIFKLENQGFTFLCQFSCTAGEKDLDDWRLVEVNLNRAFKFLVVEAWIGERTYKFDTSYGDICLDDIQFSKGACVKELTVFGKKFILFS